MFRLAVLEFGILKKYAAIYIAVMTLMCSIIVSVVSFSYNAEKMIDDKINELSEGIQFTFVFNNTEAISVDFLEEKGFSDIRREYIANTVFRNAVLSSNGTEGILNGSYTIGYNGKVYDFSGNGYTMKILSGEEINQQSFSGIWISAGLADNLNIDAGSIAYLSSDIITEALSVKIIGIFADNNNLCNFVLSEDIIDDKINGSEYTKREKITAVLPDYSTCEKVMNSADMKNTDGYCNMYNYIYQQTANIIFTCNSLKLLSVILGTTAILVLSAFISTVIYKRMHYIGMLKSMGMTSVKMIAVYGIIIEAIIFFSVALSCPVSIMLNEYISEEFNRIFNIIKLDMEYNYSAIPTVFIMENIIMIFGLIYLFKKTDRITAITVLKENE